jgi:hypothetical protein
MIEDAIINEQNTVKLKKNVKNIIDEYIKDKPYKLLSHELSYLVKLYYTTWEYKKKNTNNPSVNSYCMFTYIYSYLILLGYKFTNNCILMIYLFELQNKMQNKNISFYYSSRYVKIENENIYTETYKSNYIQNILKSQIIITEDDMHNLNQYFYTIHTTYYSNSNIDIKSKYYKNPFTTLTKFPTNYQENSNIFFSNEICILLFSIAFSRNLYYSYLIDNKKNKIKENDINEQMYETEKLIDSFPSIIFKLYNQEQLDKYKLLFKDIINSTYIEKCNKSNKNLYCLCIDGTDSHDFIINSDINVKEYYINNIYNFNFNFNFVIKNNKLFINNEQLNNNTNEQVNNNTNEQVNNNTNEQVNNNTNEQLNNNTYEQVNNNIDEQVNNNTKIKVNKLKKIKKTK